MRHFAGCLDLGWQGSPRAHFGRIERAVSSAAYGGLHESNLSYYGALSGEDSCRAARSSGERPTVVCATLICMSELRIKLEGETARLGQISAADVAQLILGVEKAALQAAAVVLGRPKTTTGRYQGVIEQAVRFRLVSVEGGSVVPVLELPELLPPADSEALDIEVSTLGQMALDSVLDVAEDTAPQPAHPLIAKALLDVAEKLHVGDRYDAIVFDESPSHARHGRHVRIDSSVRARLRACVDEANVMASRPEDLTGVLFEADFEKRTARLRTPAQGVVDIVFSAEHDDIIQTALRQSSTVRGDVVYDPHTNMVRSVRLTEVLHGIEQLVLDPGEFWRELSFQELAEHQGSGRPVDPESLYDAGATDEERDAFMTAIAQLD
jgi:hypothetical protein